MLNINPNHNKAVKSQGFRARKATRLVANTQFDAKLAQRLVDPSYYRAQGINMREYAKLERAKVRLSTTPWDRISGLIEKYKHLANTEVSPMGRTLIGLYEKNKLMVQNNQPQRNSNLLSIVSKPETLMLAYRAIRNNKGALTPGAAISKEDYNKMSDKQKELYLKGPKFPDGMNLYHIIMISKLLRRGAYPWGTSSRVYFDKPGQPGKKRPITIPPFTDRIVQKAIEITLQSIYEPVFEKLNRSFGFRPNVGTQDALAAAISYQTNGMRTAVEGDIEAAYDTVNRTKLIEILGKRIQDRQFLNLIKSRLEYDYIERGPDGKNIRVKPNIGIPQGGIDSPYLFNIYMHELDEYIEGPLAKLVDNWNAKMVKGTTTIRKLNKEYNSVRAYDKRLTRILGKVKARLKKLDPEEKTLPVLTLRKRLFAIIKQIRLNQHHKNRISSSTSNMKTLRIFYIRYADDWILLTNGGVEIATKLKSEISNFLSNNLFLKLSERKTLITEITKTPAHFLGFELKGSARGAVQRIPVKGKSILRKFNLQKRSGLLLWATPDRQRLLDRLHMKGFCSPSGFPKEVPWLSCLEAHAIVERFNATIHGLAEFYLPIVKYRSSIHRWIYILRFACLKTLAQKYRCSISKIFKRFGHNLYSKSSQTIRIRVVQEVNKKSFYKDWILLTYKDLVDKIPYEKRGKNLIFSFQDREQGKMGDYPLKTGRIPKVTNEDYLDKISWVSCRTLAALDMPCAYCGTDEDVHQHHIRHIRKRAFSLIPEKDSYQKKKKSWLYVIANKSHYVLIVIST
jgi:retron-type reverse transcriptase